MGASVGSFLNVVVYRLPAGLNLSRPKSRCPRCRTPIRGDRQPSRPRLAAITRTMSGVPAADRRAIPTGGSRLRWGLWRRLLCRSFLLGGRQSAHRDRGDMGRSTVPKNVGAGRDRAVRGPIRGVRHPAGGGADGGRRKLPPGTTCRLRSARSAGVRGRLAGNASRDGKRGSSAMAAGVRAGVDSMSGRINSSRTWPVRWTWH